MTGAVLWLYLTLDLVVLGSSVYERKWILAIMFLGFAISTVGYILMERWYGFAE
jgi:hypothetical protein